MCEVTPREVIEKSVMEYRARIAAKDAARKADADKERTKPDSPRGGTGHAPRRSAKNDDNRVARCRAYLKTLPPSVEGDNGSGRIIHAARVIWNDFAIDESDGYPLLQEFNQNSRPVWEEDGNQGLRRKWNEAVEKGPDRRGHKLEADRPDWRPTAGRTPVAKPAAPSGHAGGRDGGAGSGDGGAGSGDGSAGVPGGGLPRIVHNTRQYREVEADALAAIVRANNPPTVFVGNGCGLVDLLRSDPDSPLAARELNALSMRSVFSRVADWYSETETRDGVKRDPDFPPHPLLASFPARGEWPGLPYLRSVVAYPVYGPGWVLNATQGYHPHSLLYCDLGDLVVPHVATVPSAEAVVAARELLVTDLLGDFPFVGAEGKPNASLANAVAMLILPVIRHAIDGPTPLAVIDAPTEGTGKSLLAEVVTLTTIGEIPEAVSPDLSDEEWNKYLLAELTAGQPIVYLDNANKRLDSGSFASALTAKWKRGRILGETQIGRARVNVCWVLTSNNFECSREIARRMYWMRLDRGVENPSAHTGYVHADIIAWVRENRPKLLAAILTLVNNWLALGKPPGTEVFGKFEMWAAAVGGILAAAGIEGLLGNADGFRKQCASEASEVPVFIEAWWKRYDGKSVISSDLFTDAKAILESVLTAESDDGRAKQLGRFVKKLRDRVSGDYVVRAVTKANGKEDKDYAGRQRWRLEKAKVAKKATVTRPNEYAEGDEEFDVTA